MTTPARRAEGSQDFHAIRAAKEGDVAPLADKLRGNTDLSPELRQLAADIIEGKFKRPRHRQRKITTLVRYLMMAEHVRTGARKYGKKHAAVRSAMDEFHCDERTITRAMAQERKFFQELRNKCGPDGRMPAAPAFKLLHELCGEANRFVATKSGLAATRKR